jgi:predicted nucleotidyltransferase
MKATNEYIVLLRNYKRNYADKYGIKRMGIFGSVARGEQSKDSDVDVCVEIEKPDIFYLVHIKDDLEELFRCKVDLVHLRKSMDSFFLNRINREALYV